MKSWDGLIRKIPLSTILFIIICAASLAHGNAGYRPGELTCKMMPGYGIGAIVAEYGTTVKGHQPQTDCYLLAAPQGQDVESLAVVINARPDVDYCAVNHILSAPEPFQRSQPFLDVECIGDIYTQVSSTTLALTDAHLLSTGTSVRVAVIDGGVNFDHPLLDTMPGSVVSGWDYVDNDDYAFDDSGGICWGHGTFVAGVVRMTAPGADIYSYRVLDTAGIGDAYYIAEAIMQAISDSCRVINLSMGMSGVDPALDDALRLADRSNVLIIAAAGNDSTDMSSVFPYPASRYNCMAVAALDSLNLKADFSNFGEKIDISAPGTQIYAAYPDTTYAWWDGTSFASPFLAGTAALMISIDPTLTRDDIFTIIQETAVNIDDINPDYTGLLGAGLVDVPAALGVVASIIHGDANSDGSVDLLDILYIIDFLYDDGPPPELMNSAEMNGDGTINLLDILILIQDLY